MKKKAGVKIRKIYLDQWSAGVGGAVLSPMLLHGGCSSELLGRAHSVGRYQWVKLNVSGSILKICTSGRRTWQYALLYFTVTGFCFLNYKFIFSLYIFLISLLLSQSFSTKLFHSFSSIPHITRNEIFVLLLSEVSLEHCAESQVGGAGFANFSPNCIRSNGSKRGWSTWGKSKGLVSGNLGSNCVLVLIHCVPYCSRCMALASL